MRSLNAGWQLRTFVLLIAAALLEVFSLPTASGQCLEDTLTHADIANNGLIGFSVLMHEDHAYMGVMGAADSFGAVYQYQAPVEGEDWTLTQRIVPADAGQHLGFGWDMDADGEWLVVGDATDSDRSTGAGAAYVFRRDATGTWIQHAKLLPFAEVPVRYFGRSVAIDDGRIVVGASALWQGPRGVAHVFKLNADRTAWEAEAFFQPNEVKDEDMFGAEVAIDGDCIVVGAMGTTSQPGDLNWHGAVYAYRLNPDTDTWGLEKRFLPPLLIPQQDLGFGASVVLDGDRLVVAAVKEIAQPGFGHKSTLYFYAYDRRLRQWISEGSVSALRNSTFIHPSGWVALEGDTAVMQATFPYGNTFNAAWICKRDDRGVWQRHHFIEKPGYPYYIGKFGWSISLRDGRLMIGDWDDDTQVVRGAAFIYQVDGPDCNQNHRCDSVDISIGISHDTDGDSIPDECLFVVGDINGDSSVNAIDLLLLIDGWGPCPALPADCPADVTNDGVVNVDDLLLVINHWG